MPWLGCSFQSLGRLIPGCGQAGQNIARDCEGGDTDGELNSAVGVEDAGGVEPVANVEGEAVAEQEADVEVDGEDGELDSAVGVEDVQGVGTEVKLEGDAEWDSAPLGDGLGMYIPAQISRFIIHHSRDIHRSSGYLFGTELGNGGFVFRRR